MRVGRVTNKVLRCLLTCLIAGSTLGWFPSSVNASSTSHLLDTPVNFNLSQNRATKTSPIVTQPVSSPAAGTWEVIGTIQLSGTERPLQIAISGGKAYVSRNPGHLTVVDLSTNTVVTTINFDPYPGAAPHYIGISGGKAYVALGNLGSDGQLAVINLANNTVSAYIPVGADPHGVATFGQRVYVTNNVWWSSGDPATVKVVDTNTNSIVATIPVGINPTSIAIDPVTNKAYVTNHNDLSKFVSVINTASNSVTTTIPINNPPAAVAISSTRAYVATTINMPNGTVEVIDIGADNVVSSIPVGRDSWGIAALDDYVFVANQSSSTVSVIEVATNTVVATLSVGDDPTGVAVDPSTNRVYVTNQGDNTISIIEFREAAQPANQPPTVSITSPSNNAAVSGIVNVQGAASDPDGSSQLQMVEVKINAGTWVQASGTTSWSYSWDTMAVPDGQHSIYARSYDGQAYSSEESIVVSVNNVAPTPSLVDVGISSEAEAWPPKTFLQAKPGDRINTWYRISYAGSLVRVKLKTTIFDPNDREIGNPLNDPFLQIDGPTEDTGWVGVTFEILDEAILGTYDVRFSVWSEDGAQEYDAVVKPGWLSLDGAIHTGTIEVTSDPSGASFTLSGPANYSGITPWSEINAPVGTYTITWTPISSYQTPPQESKTLTQGGAISFYGPYQSGKGTIEVTSNPSGASFTLSGPANYSGITPWSKTDTPVGTYTITWAPISGYQTPPEESNTLTQGETISFYGPYPPPRIIVRLLSTSVSPSGGGSISVSPPPGADGYAHGTIVNATAYPAQGWQFERWSGTDNNNINPTTVIMTSDKSITAYFKEVPSGNKPKWIIVHHTGGTDEDPMVSTKHHTFEIVNNWHRKLWPNFVSSLGYHIGYHYFIDTEGKVTQGRAETEEGAHTLGKNNESIGICLAGNFDRPNEMPTERQEKSLVELIREIQRRWDIPDENVVPHRKFAKDKSCYGRNLPDDWVQSLLKKPALAQLIQQEAIGGVPVTVDGQLYVILTLRNCIDPITLEVVPDSGPTEVYVYGDRNYPVFEPDIAQKIGLIDDAQRWQKGAGSPKAIEEASLTLIELWGAHEQLENWMFARESLVQAPSLFIRAYLSGGTLALKDLAEFTHQEMQTLVESVSDPKQLLYAMIYQDFDDAQREYHAALRIAARGEITDSANARDYLEHLLKADLYYTKPAYRLLAQLDEVQRRIWEEVQAFVVDVSVDVASDLIDSLSAYGGNLEDLQTVQELQIIEELQQIYEITEVLEETRQKIRQITEYASSKASGRQQVEEVLSRLHSHAAYTLELAQSSRILAEVHSPVELRVYDSQQRVTGVVNGEERNEIPYSVYHDSSVMIFSPTDFYRYEVVGTSEGSYDLAVTTVAERTSTFTLSDVPTSASVVHQYTIDWDALAEGKKGVTVKIDSDGDGIFEAIEYRGQEGTGFPWVWIVVAGVSGLFGVLVGAFMVRRRMSRKQVPKG